MYNFVLVTPMTPRVLHNHDFLSIHGGKAYVYKKLFISLLGSNWLPLEEGKDKPLSYCGHEVDMDISR